MSDPLHIVCSQNADPRILQQVLLCLLIHGHLSAVSVNSNTLHKTFKQILESIHVVKFSGRLVDVMLASGRAEIEAGSM